MKNLKRALSFALASVMLLGMMVVGAGAVEFKDADKIEHTEAVNTMVALGVIAGKDTGNFDPEGTITRGEMAKIICVMLSGGREPNLGTSAAAYPDTANHWANSYIAYCSNLGIVAGDNHGNFNPDASVTGTEAAKMLLVALGYDSDVFTFTGAAWAINVNTQANKSKLYDDIDAKADAPLSRDNAAQMAYNALGAFIMEKTYDKVQSNGQISYNYVLSTKTTFLNEYFKALTFVGTMMGNTETLGLSNDGYIQVVGDLDTADTTVAGYTKKTANFPSDLDIANIGEEVKIIFKDGKGGTDNRPDKNDTIYGVFNTGNTVVFNITKGDLQDAGATNLGNGKIKFGDATYKMAGLAEGATDADVSAIVYNYGVKTVTADDIGGATSGCTATQFATYINTVANGLRVQSGDTIKFVADENEVIYAAYVTESKLGKVTSLTSTKITIAGIGALTIEDHDIADDLDVDDIVVYTRFYNGSDKDEAFFTVAKAETVEGEITGYTKTEKVSIEGTSYKIAGKELMANLTDDSMVSLVGEVDTNVIAYFVNGMVAAIDKNDTTASSHALIVGTNGLPTVEDDMKEGKVSLLLSDGTKATYVVDEDSKVQADAVSAGTLVKYSLNSGNVIEISKKIDTKADGKKIWNADTKIVGETAVAAADAVIYLKTSASGDYKVYNVRSLKSIDTTKDVYYVTNSSGKVTAAYAELGTVPSGATSDTLYGMITADNGVVKMDDTYYVQYKVWTSKDEAVTINVKGQNATLSTGNYVVFDESNDETYGAGDVKLLATVADTREVIDAAVKEYSSSDKVLSYYTDLNKNVDGTFSGKSLKTAAMDDDAVIIYVNRDGKKAGDSIGVNPFDTSTGYANVKIVTDKDGLILALLVETSGECDINGGKSAMSNDQLYAVSFTTGSMTQQGLTYTITGVDKSQAAGSTKVVVTVTVSGTSGGTNTVTLQTTDSATLGTTTKTDGTATGMTSADNGVFTPAGTGAVDATYTVEVTLAAAAGTTISLPAANN